MKLKKIGVTAMVLALAVGVTTPSIACAMEVQEQTVMNGNHYCIIPFWNNISDISPRISASGTMLYPEVYIEAKSSKGSIRGTMYLEKYSAGRWKKVTSWSLNGTSYVSASKSYNGSSGTKYRTRVVVNVDGEKAKATSGTCEI